MDFLKLFAELAGLTTFIFAGVAQIKQFGVSGKWLTASAYCTGLLVGGGYRFFTYPPSTGLDWFWLVAFGAGGGFLATGAYKGIESATGKNLPYDPPVTNTHTGTSGGPIYLTNYDLNEKR